MLDSELYERTLWLQKYKPETLEIISKQLDIAQDNILAFMATTKDKAKLESYINKQIEMALATFDTILNDDVQAITELAYFATGKIVSEYVSDNLSNNFEKLKKIPKNIQEKIKNPDVEIFGIKLAKELGKNKDRLKTDLLSIISEGNRQGLGIDEMRRSINNSISITRNQADAITRTVTLQALSKAQNEAFDYFEEEITEYYYNGVSDNRQTNYCRLRTGITSKNKEDITKMLYEHWRCRSVLGVRTKISEEIESDTMRVVEWDKRSVKARKGGTYTKFKVDEVYRIKKGSTPLQIFKTFKKESQIGILGKQRYDIWQSGKVSFDELFNDAQKDFISLKELKKKFNLD